MSDELRRVLKDPAHRLPDSLVDLDAVHAGARRQQRRRTGLAAAGSALAVVAIGIAVVHPWSTTDEGLPAASVGPTPTPPASHAVSPTPSPSSVFQASTSVVSVSAISSDTWWVVTGHVCPRNAFCPLSFPNRRDLLQTRDGGATFTRLSSSVDPAGIPEAIRALRMTNASQGYALVGDITGQQLWTTSDGGATWAVAKPTPYVLGLEAGGGGAWLLVEQGHEVGVVHLTGTGDTFVAESPIWLGSGNMASRGLTVQGGDALVFWFDDQGSHLSVVSSNGNVDERVNPCTPDLGVASVSGTANGLAVSCYSGTADTAFASPDGGRTWADLSSAIDGAAQRLTVGSVDVGTVVVGGQSGHLTVAHLPDGGNSQAAEVTGNRGPWSWIAFTTSSSGFAIDDEGDLFRTTDGGATWTKTTITTP